MDELTYLMLKENSTILNNVKLDSQVWMSHGDTISSMPSDFEIIASTEDVEIAAFRIKNEMTYGFQFHPEVYHSSQGTLMLKNFLLDICQCNQDWTPKSIC